MPRFSDELIVRTCRLADETFCGGDVWRHDRTGNLYEIIGATLSARDGDDDGPAPLVMVNYQRHGGGARWSRPASEWFGKFTKLDAMGQPIEEGEAPF